MSTTDTLIRLEIDSEPATRGLKRVEDSLASVASRALRTSRAFEDGAADLRDSTAASDRMSAATGRLSRSMDGLGATAERALASAAGANVRLAAAADNARAAMRGFTDNLGGVAGDLARGRAEGQAFSTMLSGIAGGAVALGATAAIAAFGGAVRGTVVAFKSAVVEAAEAEVAFRRLEVALSLRGAASAAPSLAAVASSVATVTSHTDEAVMRVQQLGLSLNVATAQVPQFTAAALDLASALGIDVDSAAKMLGQTLDGDAGRLKQLVPALASLTEEQLRAGQGIALVGQQFRGFATGDADTLKGALTAVQKAASDLAESFGVGVASTGELRQGVSQLTDALRALAPEAEAAGETIMDAFSESKIARVATAVATAATGFFSVKAGLQMMRDEAARGANARTAEEALAERGGGVLGGLAERRALKASQEELARILGVYDGIIEAADKAGKAEDARAQKAREAAEALRAQLDGVNGIAVRTAEQRAEIAGMNLPLEQQVALYEQLKGAVDAGISSVFKLYQDGKIQASEYLRLLENLVGTKQQLASSTLIERAKARISDQAPEIFELQPTYAPKGESSVAGERPDFTEAGGESAMTRVAQEEADAKARLLEIDTQLFDLRLTIAEQGGARLEQEQALNDLLWEQAALADGVIDAEERLERQRQQAIATAAQKAAKNREWTDAAAAGMGMMTQAAGQLGAGLMRMALTGEGSFKQMAQAALQGLAIQAAGKSVFEFAEGLATAALQAMGHPTAGVSAGMHFKASAVFAGMAVGFGGMSAAAGQPSEGGGADAGGASTSDSLTDQGSARRAATEEPQAGPRVQVNISGAGFIGDLDTISRHLEGFLSDSLRDSGGRNGSYRG